MLHLRINLGGFTFFFFNSEEVHTLVLPDAMIESIDGLRIASSLYDFSLITNQKYCNTNRQVVAQSSRLNDKLPYLKYQKIIKVPIIPRL